MVALVLVPLACIEAAPDSIAMDSQDGGVELFEGTLYFEKGWGTSASGTADLRDAEWLEGSWAGYLMDYGPDSSQAWPDRYLSPYEPFGCQPLDEGDAAEFVSSTGLDLGVSEIDVSVGSETIPLKRQNWDDAGFVYNWDPDLAGHPSVPEGLDLAGTEVLWHELDESVPVPAQVVSSALVADFGSDLGDLGRAQLTWNPVADGWVYVVAIVFTDLAANQWVGVNCRVDSAEGQLTLDTAEFGMEGEVGQLRVESGVSRVATDSIGGIWDLSVYRHWSVDPY